jgi:aminoglycoside phosphotransferase (APT) family kinase protein
MDSTALLRWACAADGVPTLAGLDPARCSITVEPFPHGQSNPTYLATVLSPRTRSNFVMRCRPHGKLLPSAHRIDREYQIYASLAQTPVPVPAVYGAYCRDTSVIGVEFFAMEYVIGTVYTDVSLPNVSPAERAEISSEMVRVLSYIAAVDAPSVGLASLSRGASAPWTRRQLTRWTAQYEASKIPGGDYAEMDALVTALEKACVLDTAVAPGESRSLVHGDYRLDNCIFGRKNGKLRVLAVIDWELAALGDPRADLATLCTPYFLDGSSIKQPELAAMALERPVPAGIPPSEKNIVAMYADDTGVPVSVVAKRMPFLNALALFRLAAIGYGVAARAQAGNASSRNAHLIGQRVPLLFVRSALNVLDRDAASLKPIAISNNLEHSVARFIHSEIIPLEDSYSAHVTSDTRWTPWEPMQNLKAKAKDAGLWNLWLPPAVGGMLSAVEYAPLAELMGRCIFASEVFNCSAPDTGNMELVS